jgi:hypothetical protein
VSAPPIMLFEWTGEAMAPLRPQLADKHFVVGQRYPMEVREDRSPESHRHYFAALHEAWVNLPETAAERFPSSEHLRKYALIKAGYCDQRSIACSSKAEARRLAAFIMPMDEFAVVTVDEAMVTAWTAKSQSMRAMGKKAFNESKQAVLDYVAGLIGTTADALAKNAEQAA